MPLTQSGNTLFSNPSDEEWLSLLIRSIREPVINGVEMPRYPHADTQRGSVGSADEDAMREGFNFWNHTRAWSKALGRELHEGSMVLDFGSGWGRFSRLFWRDTLPQGLHGVDVMQDFIGGCRCLGVPGSFTQIDPRGTLPFPDGKFEAITAYSVFTHLPENIATHWIQELSRVAAPGCVFTFTVEPLRFLEFIANLPDHNPGNDWYATLAQYKSKMPALAKAFRKGEFCYIPTGGGDNLSAENYGDAAIPYKFMTEKWSQHFEFVDYLDQADSFWQAVVVARKK
jgi:ubiquinone/menaquinone biosynthesis C-methylase UbiE